MSDKMVIFLKSSRLGSQVTMEISPLICLTLEVDKYLHPSPTHMLCNNYEKL